MVRVLIVAAYASVRAGLHALLGGAQDVEVVGDVGSAADAARMAAEAPPDVVLFDYSPHDAPGALEAAATASAGLVVLADGVEGSDLLTDSRLRGWAYLLRDADAEEIAAAVRAAAAGLVVLDRSLSHVLAQAVAAPPADDEGADLTAREREVLQLVAQGLPNKAVAARLGISVHTAKSHLAAILGKLGASSRTEAVTIGARRGLVAL